MKNATTFLLFSALLFLLPSCGSSQLRKQLGVKTQRVSLKSLGSKYSKYSKSRFDVFNTNKQVRKKTGRKRPLKITYLKFKMASLDKFLYESNTLYGQYRLAHSMQNKVHKDIESLLKIDIYKIKGREINSALARRNSNKISQIKRLKSNIKDLKFMMEILIDIKDKSSAVIKSATAIKKNSIAELKQDPTRALLIADVSSEVMTASKRLGRVVSGTPKLLWKFKRLISVFNVF